MSYSLLVANDSLPSEPIFDIYIGSAMHMQTYWESVAEEVGLPIISSISDRADSEEGFVLENKSLIEFKNELVRLIEYWRKGNTMIAVPDGFFENLNNVIDALNYAMTDELKVYIG